MLILKKFCSKIKIKKSNVFAKRNGNNGKIRKTNKYILKMSSSSHRQHIIS